MYNNVPGPEALRVFLGQLLDDAGISPTPELKDSMIDDLEDRLNVHLTQALAGRLEPKDFEHFAKISETDPVAGQAFLSSKINNLPEIYQQALLDFRQAFLQD